MFLVKRFWWHPITIISLQKVFFSSFLKHCLCNENVFCIFSFCSIKLNVCLFLILGMFLQLKNNCRFFRKQLEGFDLLLCILMIYWIDLCQKVISIIDVFYCTLVNFSYCLFVIIYKTCFWQSLWDIYFKPLICSKFKKKCGITARYLKINLLKKSICCLKKQNHFTL